MSIGANTQRENETLSEFLARIDEPVVFPIPKEIQALNQGLVYLDESIHYPLVLKVIGGYAIYHITGNATADIDSILRLDREVRTAVSTIAGTTELSLESKWLNDEVVQFSGFSDALSRKILSIIREDNSYFEPVTENVPKFKHLTILRAKPEVVAALKIGAMFNRSKDKDKDDLLKICKYKGWGAKELWSILDGFGVTSSIEKEDLASALFLAQIITEDQYIEFCMR